MWGLRTKNWTSRCRTEREMQRIRKEKKEENTVKARKNKKEAEYKSK